MYFLFGLLFIWMAVELPNKGEPNYIVWEIHYAIFMFLFCCLIGEVSRIAKRK